MIKREIQIINKLGLHARASTRLTQTASQFPCDTWIERNGRRVNAKSMMLAASNGSIILLETSGKQEEEAMEALVSLINSRFGEPE